MSRIFNFLLNNYKLLIVLYIFLHVIYFFLSNQQFRSDSLYYYQLSLDSLNNSSFYPSKANLFSDYIIAPLFINAEIVFLAIHKSVFSIRFFQMILNLIQFLLLFKITKKLYGQRVSSVFVILYIFYFANLGMTLLNLTELLFGVLLSSSLWFILKKQKLYYFFAGITAAASVAVRPTGWALLISIIIYFLFINKDSQIRKSLSFMTGAIIFFLIFGAVIKISSNHIVISSVNYGTNMLIGANSDATGAYNDRAFDEGKVGYLAHPDLFTYTYKQQFWFDKAIGYIVKNPIQWLKIIPLKLVHIFIWDDYAISPLFMMQDWNLYVIAKHYFIEKNPLGIMNNVPIVIQILYISFQILHHLFYYLIIVSSFFILVKNRKKVFKDPMIRLFIFIIVLSLSIPLITFGDPRFKYPYILMLMVIISPYLYNYLIKTQKNNVTIFSV